MHPIELSTIPPVAVEVAEDEAPQIGPSLAGPQETMQEIMVTLLREHRETVPTISTQAMGLVSLSRRAGFATRWD